MRRLLLVLVLLLIAPSAWASNWFVRSSTTCANNGNGTSALCASSPGGAGGWKGFSNINWGAIHGGDTLFLVPGDTYAEQLTIGASGSSGNLITISKSGGGTAIIDGGNSRTGISFNGQSFVTVDGLIGNAAFGGSQTYGIKIINIGLPNYCAYINNAEQHVKFLHVECSGNGQNTDNAHLNAPPSPDDNRGGVFGGGGAHFVEVAYNWFHTQMAQYNISSCSISGTTYTCTVTTTITDTHWTSPSVPFASIGLYGNTGVNGHCGLISVSGNTFTCEGGGSGTGTGGIAVMEWAATAVTGFFATGSTNYNDNTTHDNFAYGVFNDGFRANGNAQIYHNEAQAGMGSGHSDATLAQSALYVEISSNYVHDWNDQNCYLDNLSPASRGHIRIYNNIWNSPMGFGGCNIDPEGTSANWDDIVMINNTSYASRDYVVHYGNQGGTVTNFVYMNNISRVSGSQGSPPWGAGGGIAFATTGDPFDYNVYSPTLGVQFPIIANYSGGNKTIAQLRLLSPQREVNGNTCDVTYIGGALPTGATPAGTDNCAKGKGANLSATYPFANTDFNGTIRGTTWDTGAISAGAAVTPPNAPTGLTASASGSTVTLNWTASSGSPIPTAYTLYRGTVHNGPYTLIKTAMTSTSTTDTVANGTYFYVVTAYVGGIISTISGNSSVATVTCMSACPSFATGTAFTIAGDSTSSFNGTFTSTGQPTSSTFTFNSSTNSIGSGGGVWPTNQESARSNEASVVVGAAITVSAAPSALTFSSFTIGTSSPSQNVTMTNTSGAGNTVTFTLVAFSGTNPGDFSRTTNCTTLTTTGQQCTTQVTFTPTAAGARSAILGFSDNAAGSPQQIPVSGTGVSAAPGVSLNPTSLNFGDQTLSTTSTTRSIILTNTGSGTLTISSVVASGDFAVVTVPVTNCGGTLASLATCSLNVTFTPTATGGRVGAVTITDNAAGNPHVANLSGNGINTKCQMTGNVTLSGIATICQ